jgi:hypothetical protein
MASDRRSHGDIFPLPCRLLESRAELYEICFPHRAFWIGQALNKLGLHDVNSRSDQVLRSNLPLASTQKMVQERIMCSLQMHGMAPDGMTAESALASRKGVKTDYSGVPSNWAPFDATKPLSLRFWQLQYHQSTSKSFSP